MSLHKLGSPTGTPPETKEFAKMPCSSAEIKKGDNGVSSPLKPIAESHRRAGKLLRDDKNCEKDGLTDSIPVYPERVSGSETFDMSHPGVVLLDDPTTYKGGDRVERSISREPGSVLERAMQPLENEAHAIEAERKRKTDLFANAKDSIYVAKNSPKLKRSRSEAIRYNRRDAKIERYKEKRSSNRDVRRAKSHALVTKPTSKFMLISEKLRHSKLLSLGADKRAVEGKVFGLLFFRGKTGQAVDADVEKDRKKGKKGRKEAKNKPSERNAKKENKKSDKKTEEKRTKQHKDQKKPKTSDRDRHVKADKKLAKKSESPVRRNRKRSCSKNMETLCEFEIPSDKKVSGLVVKVRGKRS